VPDVPECLACGTCCFSLLDTFVHVSGDDHARLAEHADELVRFDGIHAFMRMVDGHCGALGIDATSGEFVCGAYATRPQVCRDLARGSGACLGERHMKAERPLLALGRLRTEARPL
jgi:Fe-S-cluster containining protein